MIPLLIKGIITRLIIRRMEKRMFGKLIQGIGVAGLIGGVVQYVSGVSLASHDIDILVSAGSILATVGPSIVAGIKAKWFTKVA